MTRFAIPCLLAGLLLAQLAYLWPAYQRSQVRMVEVVLEKPRASLYTSATDMLGNPKMTQTLHDAIRRRGAIEAASRPLFEETPRQLVARFGLLQGDSQQIAAEFAGLISLAADKAVVDLVSADAQLRKCLACAVWNEATRAKAASRAGEAFAVAQVHESRSPWLRPLDFLAMAANLAAMALFFFRQRSVGPRESQG